jgi:hypothetical protein
MIDDPLADAPPPIHHVMLSPHWIDRPIWITETTRMEVQVAPDARTALTEAGMLVATLFKRHFTGDWGTVDPAVGARNESACHTGGLVISVHRVARRQVRVETFPGHTMTWISLAEERAPSAKRCAPIRRFPLR